MKMISMSQRMRGLTAMDGWLHSAKHTKLGDMEKLVQLIWKKLQLNEYRSKTFSQNLCQRTIGILMKWACLHCKLEPFFNSNDTHLGGTVHPWVKVWLQTNCPGKRRTNFGSLLDLNVIQMELKSFPHYTSGSLRSPSASRGKLHRNEAFIIIATRKHGWLLNF